MKTTRIIAALAALLLPACGSIEALNATFTTGKGGQRTYGVGFNLRPPANPSK